MRRHEPCRNLAPRTVVRVLKLITAWPLSVLGVWLVAWLGHVLLLRSGASGLAWGGGFLIGLALSLGYAQRWRRLIGALGFPLSALLLVGRPEGAGWAWLLGLALLWWLYPRRSWADAPLFPTPAGALRPLASVVSLGPSARVLDAGCGAGDGLRELCNALPGVQVEGVEWSRPLCWLARWRVRPARIYLGDMWAVDWSAYQLVYVFQRPESMPRIWAKAQAELAPGAWLVSLAFEVPGVRPDAQWPLDDGKVVWAYRLQKSRALPRN